MQVTQDWCFTLIGFIQSFNSLTATWKNDTVSDLTIDYFKHALVLKSASSLTLAKYLTGNMTGLKTGSANNTSVHCTNDLMCNQSSLTNYKSEFSLPKPEVNITMCGTHASGVNQYQKWGPCSSGENGSVGCDSLYSKPCLWWSSYSPWIPEFKKKLRKFDSLRRCKLTLIVMTINVGPKGSSELLKIDTTTDYC